MINPIKNYYFYLNDSHKGSELPVRFSADKVNDFFIDRSSLQTPGVTSVLFAPIQFINSCIDLAKARSEADSEVTTEVSLSLVGNIFSFSYAALALFEILMPVWEFFQIFAYQFLYLSVIVPFLGTLLCVFEMVIDGIGIGEWTKLRKAVKSCPEEATPEEAKEIYLKNLGYIESKYLTITEGQAYALKEKIDRQYPDLNAGEKSDLFVKKVKNNFKSRLRSLSRRVRPLYAEALIKECASLKAGLESDQTDVRDRSLERAKELFSGIEIQLQKVLAVHLIGLAIVAIAATALAFSAAAFPFWVPLMISLTATVTAVGRAIFIKCVLDEKGWDFNAKRIPSAFVPEFVINFFTPSLNAPSPYPLPEDTHSPPLMSYDMPELIGTLS